MNVPNEFFDQEPVKLAQSLIGKVLRHQINDAVYGKVWLAAKIIETEAYYLTEKGSHSSLGLTESRKAMFMAPGTIYMYYARGGDSLNFSARGAGNAVLIKSGIAYADKRSPEHNFEIMQQMNPINGRVREVSKLCSGQTLLCKSLGLKVPDWNQQQLNRRRFQLEDVGEAPDRIVRSCRLGIPDGRDAHLPYRFVDIDHVDQATRNPLKGEYTVVRNF